MLIWIRRHGAFNYTMIDQGVVSASNFLTTIILASLLGISQFGEFSLIWMAVLFVQSMQHAVVNAPLLSIGPQISGEEEPSYFGAVVFHQLAFSLVSVLVVGIALLVLDLLLPSWGIRDYALSLTALIFVSQWQDFVRRYFFVRGKPLTSLVSDVLRYAVQILGLLAVFMVFDISMSLSATLWLIVAAALVSTLPFLPAFTRLDFNLESQKSVMVRHWKFAKWILASTPLIWMSGNFLTLAAGGILGPAAVGALKAAQNLLGVTHVFFQGLENIMPISAAHKLKKAGPIGLRKYILNLTWIGTAATILIALIFAAEPVFWLDLFYTGEYEAYSHVVQLFAIVYVVTFLGLPPRFGLRALEKTFPIFGVYAISATLTLSLAHLVIGQFGLNGVLYGLIVLQIISASFIWRRFYVAVNHVYE